MPLHCLFMMFSKIGTHHAPSRKLVWSVWEARNCEIPCLSPRIQCNLSRIDWPKMWPNSFGPLLHTFSQFLSLWPSPHPCDISLEICRLIHVSQIEQHHHLCLWHSTLTSLWRCWNSLSYIVIIHFPQNYFWIVFPYSPLLWISSLSTKSVMCQWILVDSSIKYLCGWNSIIDSHRCLFLGFYQSVVFITYSIFLISLVPPPISVAGMILHPSWVWFWWKNSCLMLDQIFFVHLLCHGPIDGS